MNFQIRFEIYYEIHFEIHTRLKSILDWSNYAPLFTGEKLREKMYEKMLKKLPFQRLGLFQII